ncbi:MAG: thioredoxin family protein [Patescibacteria group bacterium]
MANNNLQKGSAAPLVIAIVAVVLVLGVAYYVNRSETEEDVMVQEKVMIGKEVVEEKEGETMIKKEEEAMITKYAGMVLAGKSAPLLDYNKADYDSAIASDKLVVLYFYANWCPICKAETANALYPAFNELTADNVVGFRISYKDSETDSDEKALAVKYGIPYQHTKVLVKNGKQVLKAPDGWDKSRYIAEINKALAQ